MTKRPSDRDELPVDRAAERLKQFEDARRPQVPKEQAEGEDKDQGKRPKDKRGESAHEKPDR